MTGLGLLGLERRRILGNITGCCTYPAGHQEDRSPWWEGKSQQPEMTQAGQPRGLHLMTVSTSALESL